MKMRFFYNPAAITQRNGYLLQILSIDAAVTNTTISAINDIRHVYKLRKSATPSNPPDKKVIKVINELPGRLLSLRPDVFASIPNIEALYLLKRII
jgi:hypothetical protein